MLAQIGLGILLLVVTTSIHTVCTGVVLAVLRSVRATFMASHSRILALLVIAAIVILLFASALIESSLWAACYLSLGALSSFEEALYFSNVTFATLGYGDLTLDPDWRLLSSIQAANGTILFGWSTALVFAVVQWLLELEQSRHSRVANGSGGST